VYFVHKFNNYGNDLQYYSQSQKTGFGVARPMQGCPSPKTTTQTSPPVYCDLETGVGVTQGYRNRHYSIEHIRLYIRLL